MVDDAELTPEFPNSRCICCTDGGIPILRVCRKSEKSRAVLGHSTIQNHLRSPDALSPADDVALTRHYQIL